MTTELQVDGNTTRPLYRKFVRDGIEGNYEVIYEMIDLVRNGVDYDKGLETLAKGLLIKEDQSSYTDATSILKTVFDFVASRVIYLQDIAGRVESLKSARRTLEDGWGDCDDQAVLNATLLGCLGFEDVKIAMARYGSAVSFGHVYCVVYVNGKRIPFDTTLPDPQLGREVKATEVKELGVFSDVQGMDGFSGIYRNLRKTARKVAKTTIEGLPSATAVLPLGFLASNALATGATLIDRSSSQPSTHTLSATGSKINAELDKIIVDLQQGKIAHDLAKTQALQLAAQLATVPVKLTDDFALQVVGKSVRAKLEFINSFDKYAKKHGVRVVNLDPTKMLAAGVLLAGGTGYVMYQNYKNRGQRIW